jgi:hypothetical protein
MFILLALLILVIYLIPVYIEPTVVKNIITKEERNHIIDQARSKLQPSEISTEKEVDSSVRKSETAWLDLDDPVISRVVDRCLKFTDRPKENCENLQVVKYTPGGYYKPHFDSINDENPRLYTFLIALNDDYEGGETEFPNLKRKYKMKECDGLFFHNLDNYELSCSKSLHGGKPVESGEKWICNLWIRKYPYE